MEAAVKAFNEMIADMRFDPPRPESLVFLTEEGEFTAEEFMKRYYPNGLPTDHFHPLIGWRVPDAQ